MLCFKEPLFAKKKQPPPEKKSKKLPPKKTPTKTQPSPHIVLQCFPFKKTISLCRCLHLFDTKGYTKFHL